jgi:uncharacterized protein (TIGR02145 family)
MKENLNYGTKIPGGQDMINGNGPEKYCYDESEQNCSDYGGLYQWNEAMNYNTSGVGLCPDGWHIPSEADFIILNNPYQSSCDLNGYGLKEPGDTYWYHWQVSCTYSDWSALGSGFRIPENLYTDTFQGLQGITQFWTTTETTSDRVFTPIFESMYEDCLMNFDFEKVNGAPIRCLKNP